MYTPAYKTHFHDHDDTLWEVTILVNGYQGNPTEISLEGDEPCVIDWQETDIADTVHSATCTLRVSNESDRQMALLMTWRDAYVYITREKVPYWIGYLDEAVYEEPYSYVKGYVSELTFSDFGALNRTEFLLEGRQTVDAVVRDCLASMGFGNLGYQLLTTLLHPKTQQPIDLAHIYLDADRFHTDGQRGPSKREVLEEVLRPFGLRIMQINCTIRIFDPDYLRDHPATHIPIAWKGDDAWLSGSETHGVYELEFDTDAQETLADTHLLADFLEETLPDGNGNLVAMGYDEVDGSDALSVGFYYRNIYHNLPVGSVALEPGARFFNTLAKISDAGDNGMAWTVRCQRITGYYLNGLPILTDAIPLNHHPAHLLADTWPVFSLLTSYLPRTPNADSHRLRIGLDMLLSFRRNPFDNPPDGWVQNQDWFENEDRALWMHWRKMAVPVKLELIDDQGNILYHYTNATIADEPIKGWGMTGALVTLTQGGGSWQPGAATFADMVLSYYNDPDDDGTYVTPLFGKAWTGNRHSFNYGFYRHVNDGEYVILPPAGGRLRLTVGSAVLPTGIIDENYTYVHFEQFFLSFAAIRWQLYRNPEIGIVRAWRRDNGISTDPATEGEDTLNLWPNPLNETTLFGCWQKGVPPSSRGLLTDAAGTALESFVRNNVDDTLLHLRLRQLEDQTFGVQPTLGGTAELHPLFGAFTDPATGGAFLATARRQDLHTATEHVTLRRIANPGGFVFSFSWSQPVCAQQDVQFDYKFHWSRHVCVQKVDYTFQWSRHVCAQEEKYHLDWEPI